MLQRTAASPGLKESFSFAPSSSLGHTSSGLLGKRLINKGCSPYGVSKIQCKIPVVPKKKDNLLAAAEKRYLAALQNPEEGLSFTKEDLLQALSKFDYSFEVGDTVTGFVFMTDNNGALIDIGAKAPAFLPLAEASILRVKHVQQVGLVPGVEDEFYILRHDDDKGRMVLSLRQFQCDISWERCRQLQAEDAIVKGHVISANKGGVVVDTEGLRGFVPFSHVSVRAEDLEELTDKVIPLKFIEVDEEKARLVLSNKKALVGSQASLSIGSVVEGTVQTVKPYGAFVDIGGTSGLLHISQISHERITNVETVLQPGDKLKVMVLSQDRERGRISLSTKKLEPTPGDMVRNPSLVYESAEEMAQAFRERVAQAEAAARAEEQRMSQEGGSFGFISKSGLGSLNLDIDDLDLSSVPSAVEAK